MRGHFTDLTGKIFGRLTVIKQVSNPYKGDHHACWLCKCSCGKETVVPSNSLLKGNTSSCGCGSLENARKQGGVNKTHGDAYYKNRHRLFTIWNNMKQRCYNLKNPRYKNYGGNGITMCKDWKDSYITFKKWALNNGYKPGLSIDRIDNNKGYYPENCRWATQKEQQNNKTTNHYIEYLGKQYTLTTLCEELHIPYGRTLCRLQRGLSIEEAIQSEKLPIHKQK